MALSTHDALSYLMVVTASSDSQLSDAELTRIYDLIGRLPVFSGYSREDFVRAANRCADRLIAAGGLVAVLAEAIGAIPERLHDTAYALAVDVAATDLQLEQEELRFLEMVRDHLAVDRLTTAAIEAAARARFRRLATQH